MKVKVDILEHHPKNSEIYDLSNIEELVESINEVGLLQSIIVNEKYQILSGHRRFEAIKILGWKEIDVEVKEIDESETDFYLVQFNKQRVKSTKELLNEYEVVEKHIQKQHVLAQFASTAFATCLILDKSNQREIPTGPDDRILLNFRQTLAGARVGIGMVLVVGIPLLEHKTKDSF